jgi:hypothetical protein
LCFENVSTQVKKRLLIFGLLGPALGFLVLWVLTRASAGSATKDIWIAIPAVYAFELMPFCVCALVDLHLEYQARWERLAAVAVTGFVTTCAVLLMPGFLGTKLYVLQFGLVGAIPAAICSAAAHLKFPARRMG